MIYSIWWKSHTYITTIHTNPHFPSITHSSSVVPFNMPINVLNKMKWVKSYKGTIKASSAFALMFLLINKSLDVATISVVRLSTIQWANICILTCLYSIILRVRAQTPNVSRHVRKEMFDLLHVLCAMLFADEISFRWSVQKWTQTANKDYESHITHKSEQIH